jgi:Rrf2 family protein
MTLRITRRAHYATLILYHLSCLAARQLTAAESIAEALEIPPSSAKVVIRQLALAGLVQTIRGSQGGVSLARDPADISILEVVRAIDGPIVLHECIASDDDGESSADAALCQVWCEAREALVSRLGNATYEKLCSNGGNE